MKKIDKKAYHEPRYDKSHLTLVALVVAIIALALVVGGVWLFVKGILVDGAFATTWRIILGVVMAILGLPLGYVAFMMLVTASSMINVKDGNVSDVGNSAVGTVNVLKCSNCGTKLDDEVDHCPNCGKKQDGIIKCECGHKNIDSAKHCVKCGKELK